MRLEFLEVYAMHTKMSAGRPRASGAHRARRLLAVTGCTTALLAVPLSSYTATATDGNGIENLSAQEISDKTLAAFTSAQSVHATATDRNVGRGDIMSADLTLDRAGNCAGSLQFRDGGGVTLVKHGSEVWLKGDAAYWKAQISGSRGERVAELFKNSYIHGTTSDSPMKNLAGVCNLQQIQQEAVKETRNATNLRKGDPTTVDGMRTIPVLSTRSGATHTVYVATEGTPYPLKMTKQGHGADVTATFGNYNKPVPSQTPSANESVDVSKLRQEAPNAF
ncbi:hypothetical protein ACWD4J_31020 [Streptomyces sp. NPDC002577]